MLPTLDQLEDSLHRYRYWRDIGNTILVLGVVIEVLIDGLWLESFQPSPLLRGRRATTPLVARFSHLRTLRGILILVVGLATAAGITSEWLFGTWADDKADAIRIRLEIEVIEVEPRSGAEQSGALELRISQLKDDLWLPISILRLTMRL